MGIYAEYENAIRIMVPRDLHLGDEEFDQLKVGERIRIEIQKSRFQLKDPFIVSVGIYRGRAGQPTRVVNAVPAAPVVAAADEAADEPADEPADAESESDAEEEGEEEAAAE
jgi:hypothetical protein